MKATELLRQYASGVRNFHGVNLRGQSFKGQDLSGADFSDADIRGTNFKHANLQGANFIRVKAGLQNRWVAFLVIMSFLASALSGFGSFTIIAIVFLLSDRNYLNNFYAGLIYLIFLIIFLLVTFLKGLVPGAVAIAGPVAVVFAVAIAGTVVEAFYGVGDNYDIFISVAVAVAIDVAIAVVFAVAIAGAVAVAGAEAGAVVFTVAIAVAVTVAGAEAGAKAGAVTLFGFYFYIGYIGWRALKGDKRDAWVRSLAVAFAATGGTSFQGTNLKNANFTGATLKNSDFRNAILTDACFQQVRKLDLARLEETKVQQWLTGTGKDKNFEVGEFEDFIPPLRKIYLDLYHNQPIDPRLAAISFQDLKQANPKDQIELISVARTGKNLNKLHLKAETSPTANLSALQDEYFTNIEYIQSLSPKEKEILLLERGATVKRLLEVNPNIEVNPTINIDNSPQQTINSSMSQTTQSNSGNGDNVAGNKNITNDQSRTQNISGGTINASGAGASSLGDISGTVANTINQPQTSSNPDEPGIKDFLTQLQQAVDDTNLSDEDKQQTLEQLQILAVAGQDPQAETMQKKVKKAVGFLKVIADGVEPATKLAQACASVLPKILLFFGL